MTEAIKPQEGNSTEFVDWLLKYVSSAQELIRIAFRNALIDAGQATRLSGINDLEIVRKTIRDNREILAIQWKWKQS